MNIELSPSDLAFVRPPAEQRAHYVAVRRKVIGHVPKIDWRSGINAPLAPRPLTEKEAAAAKEMAKRTADAAEIEAAIKKYWENPPARTYPAIEKIVAVTARHFDVGIGDILSTCRLGEITLPRHVAMYLAKTLTPHTYHFIGKRFRRDHSTVVSAVQKIERIIAAGHYIAGDVYAIKAIVAPQSSSALCAEQGSGAVG